MTNPSPTSRRAFLKTVAAGAAGAGLAMSMPASSYARIIGANDRVRVGIVGFSDRFRSSLFPAFQAHKKTQNMEFVGVSDIWNQRRAEGVAFIKERAGVDIKPYRNNEEMYDARATDAVIISTADFQHAQHAIEAVKRGQDVYVEKPFANIMSDANEALAVIGKSDRVFQVGTQRRSSPKYWGAYEYLKSGAFGPIVMSEMTWNVNQPGRWRRPALVSTIKESDTDWKRYLLNRPYEEWDPRKYLEYRLFWPYSSGIPDQWMVHQIDTVHWFAEVPHPRSVVVNGGIYLWKDGRRNWDTMTAVFDYGPLNDPSQGFQVVYSSRFTNEAGGTKEYYYSNGGMLNLDTGEITGEGGLQENQAKAMGLKANKLEPRKLGDGSRVETGANTGGDNETTAHVGNWMECVRSRKKTNADINAAWSHSAALCMTIKAMQTGRKVSFDEAKMDVAAG